ncbi:unnamed protein product [Linum trigynum]|uniref:RRM domain-containing protein n=1 Tax=Linum trigynum TaxID=586398 RepID=A0AAV2EPX3_9ROSI
MPIHMLIECSSLEFGIPGDTNELELISINARQRLLVNSLRHSSSGGEGPQLTSDWAQQDEQNTTSTIADSEQEEEGEDSAAEEGPVASYAAAEDGDDAIEAQEPSEDAKVFVGNLSYDVDSEKLAMLFEQAGTVEIAEVIYNRETDSSRGFGFVTMSTVEEAEKAVDKFNSYDMGGRFLIVNKAAPRGSRPERAPRVFEPGCRVYVGNLPLSVDDSRLEQVFSEHGKVTNARVVYDRDSGRSRGFGFVTMADETEMNDAIAALDGQSLDGKWFPERELEFN